MRALITIIFVLVNVVHSFAQTSVWPLSNSASTADVITSPFGPREFGTSLIRYQIHWGMDIRGSEGTPIHSILDGDVKTVGRDRNLQGVGYFIDIETILPGFSKPVLIRYMHLRDEPVLNEGEPVIQGEIVGYVGKTGTNVVHLHIAYYRDSSNLDLEPRLDSSNPMHILPETNRGLYQISEESMRVVNEGTTSAPDYWLEFDFYVPPLSG